jgi:hypothetical protein
VNGRPCRPPVLLSVFGAIIAAPGVVSPGERMPPDLQWLDSRFPPNAPIPGRGLPLARPGENPTRRVRFIRACGAFGTSLAAAAMLSLGPAVVLARLSAGTPVVVVFSLSEARFALPFTVHPSDLLWLCQLVRPRRDWCARSSLIIASVTGSPRGRTNDAGVRSRGEAAPGGRGTARFAARRLRWLPGSDTALPLARRQRPPPTPGEEPPHRLGLPQAFAPATPSLLRWWAPVFLSPRV